MIAAMNDWHRPSCGRQCGPRWHDLDAHEDWGRQQARPAVVRTGPLSINLRSGAVTVNGSAVEIGGAKQLGLLLLLARASGNVVSRRELSLALYGGQTDAYTETCLRGVVVQVRRRLGDAGRLIANVRGVGYRLEMEPADA